MVFAGVDRSGASQPRLEGKARWTGDPLKPAASESEWSLRSERGGIEGYQWLFTGYAWICGSGVRSTIPWAIA